MIFLSTLLLSLFITITLIPVFRRLAIRVHALDFPNERKVHTSPVPKSGGLAMAVGTLIPVVLWPQGNELIRSIIVGAGIVVVFGILDDFKDLGYKAKFSGQVIAALVVILYGGIKIQCLGMLLPDDACIPNWLAIPLTLVVIVGVTNAVNLSDGLDGLAGGISMLSFALIGYLAYRSGNIPIAVLSFAMVGAIFGFLRFNTYPANVFMGDAGSQLLGFAAISLSLGLTQGGGALSPLLPLILLGFPVLDTLTVMLERLAQGRSPFVADKNHFHHKLLRLGLFHTEAVVLIYVVQAFLVISAFALRFYSEWLLLGLYMVFSGVILTGFFVAEKTGWRFKRYDFLDQAVKGKLKILKDRYVFIKVTFRFVAYGTPLLFLFSCLMPKEVPSYLGFASLGLVVVLLLVRLFKRSFMAHALRISLYLSIPFVVYLGEAAFIPMMTQQSIQIYNLSFGALVGFSILTMKFTRRTKGFRTTPMDFLILFIALVVPNLPDFAAGIEHMGMIAVKMIAFFFSYEVLIGELRGETRKLAVGTVVALLVVGVKGVV